MPFSFEDIERKQQEYFSKRGVPLDFYAAVNRVRRDQNRALREQGLPTIGRGDMQEWLSGKEQQRAARRSQKAADREMTLQRAERNPANWATRATMRGVETYMKQPVFGLAGFVGSAISSKESQTNQEDLSLKDRVGRSMVDWGQMKYQQSSETIQRRYFADVESMRDITGAGTFLKWGGENIIQLVPMAIRTMVEIVATKGALTAAGQTGKIAASAMAGKTGQAYMAKTTAEVMKRAPTMNPEAARVLAANLYESNKIAKAVGAISIGPATYTPSMFMEALKTHGIENPASALGFGLAASAVTMVFPGQVDAVQSILGQSKAAIFQKMLKHRDVRGAAGIIVEAAKLAPKAAIEEFGQESMALANVIWNDQLLEAGQMGAEYWKNIGRPIESALTIGFATAGRGAMVDLAKAPFVKGEPSEFRTDERETLSPVEAATRSTEILNEEIKSVEARIKRQEALLKEADRSGLPINKEKTQALLEENKARVESLRQESMKVAEEATKLKAEAEIQKEIEALPEAQREEVKKSLAFKDLDKSGQKSAQDGVFARSLENAGIKGTEEAAKTAENAPLTVQASYLEAAINRLKKADYWTKPENVEAFAKKLEALGYTHDVKADGSLKSFAENTIIPGLEADLAAVTKKMKDVGIRVGKDGEAVATKPDRKPTSREKDEAELADLQAMAESAQSMTPEEAPGIVAKSEVSEKFPQEALSIEDGAAGERQYVNSETGQRFDSVTTRIAQHRVFKFDMESAAERYARKYSMDVDQVLSDWKRKKDKGSALHTLIELGLRGKLPNEAPQVVKDVVARVRERLGEAGEVHPEVTVWSDKYGAAGTIDGLVRLSDGTYELYDVKTLGKDYNPHDADSKYMQRGGDGKVASKFDRHALQLRAYIEMLAEKGIQVSNAYVIPVVRGTVKQGQTTPFVLLENFQVFPTQNPDQKAYQDVLFSQVFQEAEVADTALTPPVADKAKPAEVVTKTAEKKPEVKAPEKKVEPKPEKKQADAAQSSLDELDALVDAMEDGNVDHLAKFKEKSAEAAEKFGLAFKALAPKGKAQMSIIPGFNFTQEQWEAFKPFFKEAWQATGQAVEHLLAWVKQWLSQRHNPEKGRTLPPNTLGMVRRFVLEETGNKVDLAKELPDVYAGIDLAPDAEAPVEAPKASEATKEEAVTDTSTVEEAPLSLAEMPYYAMTMDFYDRMVLEVENKLKAQKMGFDEAGRMPTAKMADTYVKRLGEVVSAVDKVLSEDMQELAGRRFERITIPGWADAEGSSRFGLMVKSNMGYAPKVSSFMLNQMLNTTMHPSDRADAQGVVSRFAYRYNNYVKTVNRSREKKGKELLLEPISEKELFTPLTDKHRLVKSGVHDAGTLVPSDKLIAAVAKLEAYRISLQMLQVKAKFGDNPGALYQADSFNAMYPDGYLFSQGARSKMLAERHARMQSPERQEFAHAEMEEAKSISWAALNWLGRAMGLGFQVNQAGEWRLAPLSAEEQTLLMSPGKASREARDAYRENVMAAYAAGAIDGSDQGFIRGLPEYHGLIQAGEQRSENYGGLPYDSKAMINPMMVPYASTARARIFDEVRTGTEGVTAHDARDVPVERLSTMNTLARATRSIADQAKREAQKVVVDAQRKMDQPFGIADIPGLGKERPSAVVVSATGTPVTLSYQQAVDLVNGSAKALADYADTEAEIREKHEAVMKKLAKALNFSEDEKAKIREGKIEKKLQVRILHGRALEFAMGLSRVKGLAAKTIGDVLNSLETLHGKSAEISALRDYFLPKNAGKMSAADMKEGYLFQEADGSIYQVRRTTREEVDRWKAASEAGHVTGKAPVAGTSYGRLIKPANVQQSAEGPSARVSLDPARTYKAVPPMGQFFLSSSQIQESWVEALTQAEMRQQAIYDNRHVAALRMDTVEVSSRGERAGEISRSTREEYRLRVYDISNPSNYQEYLVSQPGEIAPGVSSASLKKMIENMSTGHWKFMPQGTGERQYRSEVADILGFKPGGRNMLRENLDKAVLPTIKKLLIDRTEQALTDSERAIYDAALAAKARQMDEAKTPVADREAVLNRTGKNVIIRLVRERQSAFAPPVGKVLSDKAILDNLPRIISSLSEAQQEALVSQVSALMPAADMKTGRVLTEEYVGHGETTFPDGFIQSVAGEDVTMLRELEQRLAASGMNAQAAELGIAIAQLEDMMNPDREATHSQIDELADVSKEELEIMGDPMFDAMSPSEQAASLAMGRDFSAYIADLATKYYGELADPAKAREQLANVINSTGVSLPLQKLMTVLTPEKAGEIQETYKRIAELREQIADLKSQIEKYDKVPEKQATKLSVLEGKLAVEQEAYRASVFPLWSNSRIQQKIDMQVAKARGQHPIYMREYNENPTRKNYKLSFAPKETVMVAEDASSDSYIEPSRITGKIGPGYERHFTMSLEPASQFKGLTLSAAKDKAGQDVVFLTVEGTEIRSDINYSKAHLTRAQKRVAELEAQAADAKTKQADTEKKIKVLSDLGLGDDLSEFGSLRESLTAEAERIAKALEKARATEGEWQARLNESTERMADFEKQTPEADREKIAKLRAELSRWGARMAQLDKRRNEILMEATANYVRENPAKESKPITVESLEDMAEDWGIPTKKIASNNRLLTAKQRAHVNYAYVRGHLIRERMRSVASQIAALEKKEAVVSGDFMVRLGKGHEKLEASYELDRFMSSGMHYYLKEFMKGNEAMLTNDKHPVTITGNVYTTGGDSTPRFRFNLQTKRVNLDTGKQYLNTEKQLDFRVVQDTGDVELTGGDVQTVRTRMGDSDLDLGTGDPNKIMSWEEVRQLIWQVNNGLAYGIELDNMDVLSDKGRSRTFRVRWSKNEPWETWAISESLKPSADTAGTGMTGILAEGDHPSVADGVADKLLKFANVRRGGFRIASHVSDIPLPGQSHVDAAQAEAQVKGLLDRALNIKGFEIELVASYENLPEHVQQAISMNPEAASLAMAWTDDSKAYIILDRHHTNQDVMKSALHEAIAHNGLKAVFPIKDVSYETLLDSVWTRYNAEAQTIFDNIIPPQYREGFDSKRLRREWQHKAAEEVIGRLVESAEVNEKGQIVNKQIGNYFDRVVTSVMRGLRKLGLYRDVNLTRPEIMTMLGAVYKRRASKYSWGIAKAFQDLIDPRQIHSLDVFGNYTTRWTDKLVMNLADGFRPIEQLAETIKKHLGVDAKKNEHIDAHGEAGIYRSRRSASMFLRLKTKHFDPLKKKLGDLDLIEPHGFSKTLDDYIRNYMQYDRDTSMFSAPKGLTHGQMKEVLKMIDGINRETIQVMRDFGLRSQATIDKVLSRGGVGHGRNKLFLAPVFVGSKPVVDFLQEGKLTVAAIGQLQATLAQAHKNEVKRKLYNLLKTIPQREAGKIYREITTPPMDKELAALFSDVHVEGDNANEFSVWMDGKRVRVELVSKHLASALHALSPAESNKIFDYIGMTTRMMAATLIKYNPFFWPRNFIRDTKTAIIHLHVGGRDMGLPEGIAKDVTKMVPSVMMDLNNFKKGMTKDGKTIRKEIYDWYMADGVQTGYSDLAGTRTDFNDLSSIEKALGQGRKAPQQVVFKAWDQIEAAVSRYNEVCENVARLALYQKLIDSGMGRHEASLHAKNLTVNFDRRGNMRWLNSMYLFFNAAVQGPASSIRWLAANPKRAKAMMRNIVFAGFAMSQLARMTMGEDEDGVPLYDKLSDFEKTTNFIIPTGGGDYIKIPKPYFFGFFADVGRKFSDLLHGESPITASFEIVGSMGYNFAPLGFDVEMTKGRFQENLPHGISKLFAPTVANPIMDIIFGKTSYSTPLLHDPDASAWQNTRILTTYALKQWGGGAMDILTDVIPTSLGAILQGDYGDLPSNKKLSKPFFASEAGYRHNVAQFYEAKDHLERMSREVTRLKRRVVSTRDPATRAAFQEDYEAAMAEWRRFKRLDRMWTVTNNRLNNLRGETRGVKRFPPRETRNEINSLAQRFLKEYAQAL